MDVEKNIYFIKIDGKKFPKNFTELSDIVSFSKQFKDVDIFL